jgi:hypothetical protein
MVLATNLRLATVGVLMVAPRAVPPATACGCPLQHPRRSRPRHEQSGSSLTGSSWTRGRARISAPAEAETDGCADHTCRHSEPSGFLTFQRGAGLAGLIHARFVLARSPQKSIRHAADCRRRRPTEHGVPTGIRRSVGGGLRRNHASGVSQGRTWRAFNLVLTAHTLSRGGANRGPWPTADRGSCGRAVAASSTSASPLGEWA